MTLPPVALKLEGCVAELPTFTLPKLREVGETISFPATLLMPVPASGTFVFGPETKTLPPIKPADCGENEMFTVTLWPAVSTSGSAGVLILKPEPVV